MRGECYGYYLLYIHIRNPHQSCIIPLCGHYYYYYYYYYHYYYQTQVAGCSALF